MSTVVRLRGPLSEAAIAAAEAFVTPRGHLVLRIEDCDLSVVDAVSRLRLLARRHGAVLDVVGADAALFAACGLDDVL